MSKCPCCGEKMKITWKEKTKKEHEFTLVCQNAHCGSSVNVLFVSLWSSIPENKIEKIEGVYK